MNDNFLVVAMLAGVGFMLVGWVWSVLIARKVSVGWFAGMAFIPMIALPLFAYQYWDKVKKPFIVWVIGIVLTLGFVFLAK